jgi:putative aldouronate transport system permease protein
MRGVGDGSLQAIDRSQLRGTLKIARRNWILYLFIVPSFVYIILFSYWPMYGVQIAFRDFSAYLGVWDSPWVGLKHFIRFFKSYQISSLIRNTLTLSLYSLIASFPIPIFLAIVFNYTSFKKIKKFAQTATYAPHLISTVVMVGMLLAFMTQNGVINQLLGLFGLGPYLLNGSPRLFPSIYVWSGIWQNTGWSSIIYIAVLTGVSSELHEAAIVDGATVLRRIWHIDMPALIPTITILFIMNMGSIMNVGFEKVFLLQNNMNLETSEIIATYVYKVGIRDAQYSFATAVGLFNNIINIILLTTVNKIARFVTGSGLW